MNPTPAWTLLISAEAIAARVREAGIEIARDYGGEEILLIGLLQGAVFFLADLARAIAVPLTIETMRPQSYGGGLASGGRVELAQEIRTDIRGRHVLVVDDIYDSGRTLRFVHDHLARRQPKSLEIACLLVKNIPATARAAEVRVKYGLFPIPDVFVVGCGLDLGGLGRNLPGVWALAAGVSEQAAAQQLLAQLGGRGEAHGGDAERARRG